MITRSKSTNCARASKPKAKAAAASSPRVHVGRRRGKETAFCGVIRGGRPLSVREGQYHHPETMDSEGNPTGKCAHGHRIILYNDFPVFVVRGAGATTFKPLCAPRHALATKAERKSLK